MSAAAPGLARGPRRHVDLLEDPLPATRRAARASGQGRARRVRRGRSSRTHRRGRPGARCRHHAGGADAPRGGRPDRRWPRRGGGPVAVHPGVLYGENRPAGSTLPYPAWRLDPDADDPWASDRWVVRADRAATPMALASNGVQTIAIATREKPGSLGIHRLEVAATHETTEVAVWGPFQERPVRYDGAAPAAASARAAAPVGARETRTIEARVFVGPPGRQAFAPILRALDPWLAAASGGGHSPPAGDAVGKPRRRRRARGGGSPALALAPRGGVLLETAAFERGPGDHAAGEVPGDRLAMHVAWLSGVPAATALLAPRPPDGARSRVASRPRGPRPSAPTSRRAGTFWGQWTASDGWTKGWTPGEDAAPRPHDRRGDLFLGPRRGAAPPGRAPVVGGREPNAPLHRPAQRDDGALGRAWNGRPVESWAGRRPASPGCRRCVEGAAASGSRAWRDVARAAGAHYAASSPGVPARRAGGRRARPDVGGRLRRRDRVRRAGRAPTDDARPRRWLDLAVGPPTGR